MLMLVGSPKLISVCSFLFHIQLSNFFTFMLDHCNHPDSGNNKNKSDVEIVFEKLDAKKVNFQCDIYSLCHLLRFDVPNTVIRI